MVYFLFYAVLLLFVVILYLRSGVKLSLFNIYFGFFLLFYGPAFFLYVDDHNLFKREYAVTTVQMLIIFVICFFYGRFLFTKWQGQSFAKITSYDNWVNKVKPEAIAINFGLLKFFVLLSTVVVVLGLFFYGGIASLLNLIHDPFADAQAVKELRSEGGVTGWIAPFYIYIIAGFARFVAFAFIGIAFYKRSLSLKVIGFAFAFLLGIAYLANLSKSSFLVFYVQLLVFMLLLLNVKINLTKGILVLLLAIPLLIGIYIVSTNSTNATDALSLIGGRIFDEPNRVLLLYPEYYPNIYHHTYGMNIRVIHNLFTNESFVPANIAVTGGFEKTSFNAMFIADAYVDFSFVGVALQSIFVGYLLAYLDFMIFRRNNYLKKALFASMLFGVFSMINSGLIASLFAFGLVTLPVWSYMIETKASRKLGMQNLVKRSKGTFKI